MRRKKKGLILLAAVFLLAGSFEAAASCRCSYGYGNGPGGPESCRCLENQGPNGDGACTCGESRFWPGGRPFYGDPACENGWYCGGPACENGWYCGGPACENGWYCGGPAYENGWYCGGPGNGGCSSMGQPWDLEYGWYCAGPGISENRAQAEPASYYIYGEPCTSGYWEQQENGSWKLMGEDGSYVSSKWACLDGKTYLIDYDGTMLTGFRRVNGNWYYFNSTGVMQTGWLLKGGRYYFFNSDGIMSSGWVSSQGNWYYLDPVTGVMQTNGYTPDGKYVNAEGILIQ